jgi:drug/metabolite transporter (DMT)-like permease
MWEYIFVVTAVALFSIQFVFTKKYQQAAGSGMASVFLFNTISPIAFVVILFFMDGMKIEVTWFALILSFLWALVCNICSYFSIKALEFGSLTNYSLYLMSGGMILPILYGAVFEHDPFSVPKLIGIFVVIAAMFVKMDFKEKTNWKVITCFLLLFVLNGAVGVISSVYQSKQLSFEKVSSMQFSLLGNLFRVVTGAIMYFGYCLRKREDKSLVQMRSLLKGAPWAAVCGICNGVANLLLLMALAVLAPSLQYPLVTGGCIVLGAVFGCFFKEKISLRVGISVVLAMIGTIVMAL